MEERLIEERAAKRVEELVAKRVEEELQKRKDEIEKEVRFHHVYFTLAEQGVL